MSWGREDEGCPNQHRCLQVQGLRLASRHEGNRQAQVPHVPVPHPRTLREAQGQEDLQRIHPLPRHPDRRHDPSKTEYEALMADSAAKRAADSKSITDKDSEKASTEESLQAENEAKADTTVEHMNTMKEIGSLHGECDWLVKYFDVRKQARADEIESLSNAKAVLNGATYSLIQQSRLRGVSKHA